MGTQTLIQALQAMPWEDDRDEDISEPAIKRERGKARQEHISADSSEDEESAKAGECSKHWCKLSTLITSFNSGFALASSIHTIHRPVARSRLATPAFERAVGIPGNPPLEVAEDYFSNPLSADEDDGLRDFDEETTPDGVPNPFKEPSQMKLHLPEEKLAKIEGKRRMPPPTRAASMATVRMKRRAKLADKLKEVFGIPDIKEVVAGRSYSSLCLRGSRSHEIQKCRVGSCVQFVSDFACSKI